MSADLLLLVDAGNTHTVFGLMRGERLLRSFRCSTHRERTADELASLLLPLLGRAGVTPDEVAAVAICSVVPPLDPALDALARDLFGCEPWRVEPGVRTGMRIRYDNPAEVGADRIVNAVAAREAYGSPVVVVDFGTATTFDVVSSEGDYVGGIIAPGAGISAQALVAHASRLSQVDLRRPERLVGRTTAAAMQSGIYFGYVGLVDGILRRLHDEMPGLRRVVATGGLATLFAGGSELITDVDADLTLLGLQRIHALNR